MANKDYRPDPPVELIRQSLRYEDGKLFWLKRPREHFATERGFKIFTVRFVGKEAGSLRVSKQGREQRWYVEINDKSIPRARLVWVIFKGAWPSTDKQIDHKDVNCLNDRIGNLRAATESQNRANSKLRLNNTSGFKGVSAVARTGRWHSQITVNNRHIFLGSYATPELAHAAYVTAAEKYHGEFACSG